MANVNTTVIIEVTGHGTITLGKHGAATDSILKPLATTVAGGFIEKRGTITTGAGNEVLIFDSTVDVPATFLKFFYWSDVATQIQLITAGTEVTIGNAANDVFLLSTDATLASVGLLASAGTTNNTAEATLAAIDEITIGNYSGGDAVYHMILVL